VRIQDDAVIAAVQLSSLYITSRFMPDKAIDLMNEEAAKLSIERNSMPEELDDVTRRLRQLEIEREAIKREKDTEKLEQLSNEIDTLRKEETKIRTQWQSEKSVDEKIQKDKDEIEQLKFQAEKAEREVLRNEYRAGVVANLTAQLDNTVIVRPDGTTVQVKDMKRSGEES
jgi:ATP-dependent Clp protease ATP-binding subunit ClpB